MVGTKRRGVESITDVDNTSESTQNATQVKYRKPFPHPGKENIAAGMSIVKDTGGVSEKCSRTDGRHYPIVKTQTEYRPLSQLDINSTLVKFSTDSDWDRNSCFGISLDELDSEILGSCSLGELDVDIFESPAYTCESTPPCEPQQLKCDQGKVVSWSIESRLLSSSLVRNGDVRGEEDSGVNADAEDEDEDEFESTQFDVLMKLCAGGDESKPHEADPNMVCPLCGLDISELNEESRQFHANECLDKSLASKEIRSIDAKGQASQSFHGSSLQSPAQPAADSRVRKWLHNLRLSKYEAAFIQQEIDWDSLKCLTEEDLIFVGINALGPRKKMMQSIRELRKRDNKAIEEENGRFEQATDVTKNSITNKLITDFFPSPLSGRKTNNAIASGQQQKGNAKILSHQKQVPVKNNGNGKIKDIPPWCSIPGTPFRVDAFRYLRRDCSHWFLTHFHTDHYQGLTKSFSYGKIYCSMITAKLINTKIGIPWEKLQVVPLNQKINIAGVDVTCYDANHCPGAIIILFEPPNSEAVLHTGDFRLNEEMATIPTLQTFRIHTLILDTTYCNPQYNFPKQEVVVQFVIEAIQAEAFNPKTLFLIGSYTIGKERLFLEVARVLQKKVYVPAAKLRLLECLELPAEDMQWFTLNEKESNIHVVPMWTIASFKRLKQLSDQYAARFSLIIAFSPTGWTLGKGKKTAGRRRQQGTMIRYEVPYSEHCSFEELKEFVKLVSPDKIIPSVNNEDEASSNSMIELLLS